MTGQLMLRLSPEIEVGGVEPDYQDARCVRRRSSAALRSGATLHSVDDRFGSTVHRFLSLAHHQGAIEFLVDGVSEVRASGEVGHVIRARSRLYWVPRVPVERRRDAQGRVLHDAPVATQFVWDGDRVKIRCQTRHPEATLDFAYVVFGDQADRMQQELTEPQPCERRHYRSTRLDYTGLADAWLHFLAGDVFDRWVPGFSRRCQNQQASLHLYELFELLGNWTGKSVYRLLQDLVAYSTLLSMADGERWRQGTAIDSMETQTRLQADGILMLLHHHRRSGVPLFLERAEAATDYLVGLADTLDDGALWFLHDTMELDLATSSQYYKLEPSTAFGKSLSNTLCLNTHLRTLEIIAELKRVTGTSKYNEAFERGMRGAARVLREAPATWLYRGLCALYEWAAGRRSDQRLGWHPAFEFVDKATNRLMKRAKRHFPRLTMPNGFIERDLVSTAANDYYHVQNVQDILRLAQRSGDARLLPYVAGALGWARRQRFGRLLTRQPGTSSLLATYALEAARRGDPEEFAEPIHLGLLEIADRGFGVPLGLHTDTLISDPTWAACDPRVVPVGMGGGQVLVVNCADYPLEGIDGRGAKWVRVARPATRSTS